MLLIMGLGCQMIRWNQEICDGLVARGFRVIRFDNRDCGLSTRCESFPIPDFRGFMQTGHFSALPYTLNTLADDAMGLLRSLGIAQADVVGASMGGAIAQIMAARYPESVLSLTCMMCSSGNPLLPPPTPEAMASLISPLPLGRDRETIVRDAIKRFKTIASPGFPTSTENLEALFGAEFDRGFYPAGVARQLAALMGNGDRRPLLQSIQCPTVVLHGKDDPLIPYPHGEDVANNIPKATLIGIEGMGHDFPKALTASFVEAITRAAA